MFVSGSLSLYYLLNYERQVFNIGKKREGCINLAIGLGGCYAIDISHAGGSGTATTFIISSNFISGGNRHHFETDIGLVFNSKEFWTGFHFKTAPDISLGYRFQQKENPIGNNNPLVFRAGIGYPQIIYLSLGFAF